MTVSGGPLHLWLEKVNCIYLLAQFFYGIGILFFFFFHKTASQDENLQYGCTIVKFTPEKNASTLSPPFLKTQELHISADNTNNKQLVELRSKWANVLCYFTELGTGPEGEPERQHPCGSLAPRVSGTLPTWKYTVYWDPEDHFIFETYKEILEFLPENYSTLNTNLPYIQKWPF